jgi:hypothetical protein
MPDKASEMLSGHERAGSVPSHGRLESGSTGIAGRLPAAVARLSRRALLVGAAALGIAGCGSSSSTTSTQSPVTTAAAASTSTTTSSTGTSTSGEGESGVTKPGTALAVGQSATVPFERLDTTTSTSAPKLKMQVKVTAIEKGTLNDFNGIKLDASQKAGTPYYVKVQMTNLSALDGGTDPAVDVQGVDSTGETQQSVTFLGSFPRCESKEPPKPFTKGKSFETCLVFLVPGGITKAAYTGTEAYISTPVTWK